jgi:hypothetical protein
MEISTFIFSTVSLMKNEELLIDSSCCSSHRAVFQRDAYSIFSLFLYLRTFKKVTSC